MFKFKKTLFFSIVFLVVLDKVFKCSAYVKPDFGDFRGHDKKHEKKEKGWWGHWKDLWSGKEMDEDKRLREGKEKIRYLLRDRKGQGWFEMERNGSVPDIWFKDSSTKLLIHGFAIHHSHGQSKIIRDQKILDMGIVYGKKNSSLNIIVVDWTVFAVEPIYRYQHAVNGVYTSGKDIAEFLIKLQKEGHIKDWKNIHIIGFNLGAHVAAVAARQVQNNKNDSKIGRVTGLDPMGPNFHDKSGNKWNNESVSLGKSVAEFVDIIHCNMGKSKNIQDAVSKGRFGSPVQSGHADFYPNGGSLQKGCHQHDETPDKMCSARKCVEYFADSITNKHIGCLCDDWDYFQGGKCNCTLENDGNLMGDPAKPPVDGGRYYLRI